MGYTSRPGSTNDASFGGQYTTAVVDAAYESLAADYAAQAAISAASANAAYDSFDDRYLGEKASEPTVDNDGNALVSGAMFFHTGVGMKVWNGGAWEIAYSPSIDLTSVSGGIASPDYVQFNTGATLVPTVGRLGWDSAESGLSILMEGGNVNLQLGQETVVRVYNNTGSPLTDGQIVYCTGSQGTRLTVALAQANSDATSAAIIGMVTEPIANNSSGFITVQGRVSNINTTGIADGTILYLSPTTPGAWTTTKPVAPNHMVLVGYVVKGNSAGAGSVYVHVQNGYEIDELHDVKITAVTNNDILVYDNTIPAWKNTANLNGVSIGSTTPSTGAFTSLGATGNLAFTGTGNRITGDFSNATVANRVMFQTSTTNGGTFLYAIPNGTSTSAGYTANNNSSDPANGSEAYLGVSSTSVTLNSNIRGTGTYLPVTFYTGGVERVRISTNGDTKPYYTNSSTVSTTSTFSYSVGTHGQVCLVTMTNAITVTFGAPANITEGAMYKLILKAGDTNARTFAWNSAYKFPAATSPLTSGTTTNGAFDVITFIGGAANTLIYDGHTTDLR